MGSGFLFAWAVFRQNHYVRPSLGPLIILFRKMANLRSGKQELTDHCTWVAADVALKIGQGGFAYSFASLGFMDEDRQGAK